MALALNPLPMTQPHVLKKRHLYLVPELDPTPVRASRPSLATRPTSATFQRRRLMALVMAMLILGVVVAGIIGSTGTSAQADQVIASESVTPRTVIAQPGDTLWAIARRIAPQGNISDLVDQLVRINGDAIVAGQLVRIP